MISSFGVLLDRYLPKTGFQNKARTKTGYVLFGSDKTASLLIKSKWEFFWPDRKARGVSRSVGYQMPRAHLVPNWCQREFRYRYSVRCRSTVGLTEPFNVTQPFIKKATSHDHPLNMMEKRSANSCIRWLARGDVGRVNHLQVYYTLIFGVKI